MTISYSMHSSGGDMPDGLDAKTIIALESALVTIFQATQAAVHIHSGRLRASGRFSTSHDENTWEGEITYGGGSSGVDYAWYEARRGGLHDFMDVAQNMNGVVGAAFRVGMED